MAAVHALTGPATDPTGAAAACPWANAEYAGPVRVFTRTRMGTQGQWVPRWAALVGWTVYLLEEEGASTHVGYSYLGSGRQVRHGAQGAGCGVQGAGSMAWALGPCVRLSERGSLCQAERAWVLLSG